MSNGLIHNAEGPGFESWFGHGCCACLSSRLRGAVDDKLIVVREVPGSNPGSGMDVVLVSLAGHVVQLMKNLL